MAQTLHLGETGVTMDTDTLVIELLNYIMVCSPKKALKSIPMT